MMQKNSQVLVRGADGEERKLMLIRTQGKTAYVCAVSRYREAIEHPNAGIEVGVPVSDVRSAKKEAAN